MASASYARVNRAAHRRSRRRWFILAAVRRLARSRWREFQMMRKALAASPPMVRILVGGILILLTWASMNWTYHAINKPTEVFFPLDTSLAKSPPETWQQEMG